MKYVHHNKCAGGYAIDEVDHNTYCLGRADSYYEDIVLVPECKKCPRLIYNNEDKIDEYINRRKGEPMADIGNICDYCPDEEHDCMMCPLGNPCLNCADYDKVNGLCKSNGGCAPERRTDGEKQSD